MTARTMALSALSNPSSAMSSPTVRKSDGVTVSNLLSSSHLAGSATN
jgi:hypothetical protein